MIAKKWMKMIQIFKVKLNKNLIEFKKYSKVSKDNLIESIGMMKMEVSLKEPLIHNMSKIDFMN